MHDIAAGQDQDALGPQGRQGSADIDVVLRALPTVDAELDDRHVGGWIHPAQHAPSPMVQAPVSAGRCALFAQQLDHITRQVRMARRRVFNLV